MGSLSVAYLCGQVPATNPRPEIIDCAGGPFHWQVALWSPEYISVLRHCHLIVPEVLRVQDLMLRVARPCHYRSPPVPLRSHQHHRQAQKDPGQPKRTPWAESFASSLPSMIQIFWPVFSKTSWQNSSPSVAFRTAAVATAVTSVIPIETVRYLNRRIAAIARCFPSELR